MAKTFLAALKAGVRREVKEILKMCEKLWKCLKVQGLAKKFWRSFLKDSIKKHTEKLQKYPFKGILKLKRNIEQNVEAPKFFKKHTQNTGINI